MNPYIAVDALRVLEIVEQSISRDPTPDTGREWVQVLRWVEANVRYLSGMDCED